MGESFSSFNAQYRTVRAVSASAPHPVRTVSASSPPAVRTVSASSPPAVRTVSSSSPPAVLSLRGLPHCDQGITDRFRANCSRHVHHSGRRPDLEQTGTGPLTRTDGVGPATLTAGAADAECVIISSRSLTSHVHSHVINRCVIRQRHIGIDVLSQGQIGVLQNVESHEFDNAEVKDYY